MATAILAAPARAPARARALAWRVNLPRDRWLTATLGLAIALSVGACWLAYQHHTILLYSDAYSHMIIARRVLDNTTPGLAQLGSVWLPLPHLVMLPFVWNMFLWASGLGGAIPSMICYVVSAVYIFLSARRMTQNSVASFAGTLVFLLNPNILYVQATPLTEPLLIATFTMTAYYFLAWAQDGRQNDLIWAGLCTFFASIARYDGWPLYLAILVLIAVIGWQKRHTIKQIKGNLLLYGTLGGFAIVLWFLWNKMIFGDALYFLTGPYSSQIMQAGLIQQGLDQAYHSLPQSILTYSVASAETLGPVLFALAVLAVVAFAARRRFSPEVWASLAFLVPFAFYIVALYGGQAVLYAPHAFPAHATIPFYNDRYGTQVVAPAAFFIATLAASFPRWGRTALVGAVIAQSALVATGGIITLQDGLSGVSCAPARATTAFLARYYDGGDILEDTYFRNPQDYAFTVSIDLKNIIYQGSGTLWNQALDNPAATVHWIFARPGDLVATHIDVNSPAFLALFVPVASDSDGAMLFHLRSAPLVAHTVAPGLLSEHAQCGSTSQLPHGTSAPSQEGARGALSPSISFQPQPLLKEIV